MAVPWQTVELTDENEGHWYNECEDVATDWLIVLAVSLGKEVQDLVDVVLTQSLRRDRACIRKKIVLFLFSGVVSQSGAFITDLEDFGCTDEGSQGRWKGGWEGSSNDQGTEARYQGHHLNQRWVEESIKDEKRDTFLPCGWDWVRLCTWTLLIRPNSHSVSAQEEKL